MRKPLAKQRKLKERNRISPNSSIKHHHKNQFYIKVRTDRTQQNSKCRLYGDRNKTINRIISKCSKLV